MRAGVPAVPAMAASALRIAVSGSAAEQRRINLMAAIPISRFRAVAARWSAENPNVKGPAHEGAMQQQAWDPSVKALAAVPQALTMMSDKLEWTKALGDAYLAQPDDVAAAVQQLRARADAAGNLKSSNEQQVRRVAARRGSSASPRCPNTTPSSRSTPTSSMSRSTIPIRSMAYGPIPATGRSTGIRAAT
jgi:hypothetical protein